MYVIARHIPTAPKGLKALSGRRVRRLYRLSETAQCMTPSGCECVSDGRRRAVWMIVPRPLSAVPSRYNDPTLDADITFSTARTKHEPDRRKPNVPSESRSFFWDFVPTDIMSSVDRHYANSISHPSQGVHFAGGGRKRVSTRLCLFSCFSVLPGSAEAEFIWGDV